MTPDRENSGAVVDPPGLVDRDAPALPLPGRSFGAAAAVTLADRHASDKVRRLSETTRLGRRVVFDAEIRAHLRAAPC